MNELIVNEIENSMISDIYRIDWEFFMLDTIAFLFRIIVVFFIGFICIKVSKRVIDRIFSTQKAKMSERKMKTLSTLFKNVAKYFIYFIMTCEILSRFGIDMTSILAVAGVGSVAIGFGAQGLVKDFITGLYIITEDQFGIGDTVTINGFSGTVEEVGMRTTRIRDGNGSVHIIPNSSIGIVTNANK